MIYEVGAIVIFDTDVIIWYEKGNKKAAQLIDQTQERYISTLTYMELLQCAFNKQCLIMTKQFLHDFNFLTLPLTENIGHRAAIYIEQHTLSAGLRAADAIIAATAIENTMPLTSSNKKHFKIITELDLIVFNPLI